MSDPERRLVRAQRPARFAFLQKVAVAMVALLLLGVAMSKLNLSRDLHRLHAGFLSGSKEGNYHAIVDDLAAMAALGKGQIVNLASQGSAENVRRLGEAAAGGCQAQFALAQDGADWSAGGPSLRLVARLPRAESVFFLGRNADALTDLSALAGMKVGIGPEGSGTAHLARQIFALPEIQALGAQLSNHTLAEQLELAERGELGLAVFVMDEDAPLITTAIRERGLQLAGFSHIDSVARRLPHFRTGRIGAGEYEAVRILPAQDKRVLRVETVVLVNACATRSNVIDLMTVLTRRFPDLLRHNKETPNGTNLELASAARGFLSEGGPELADQYAPWLVDVMPPANWATIVMGISLLFNAMAAGHRFRLWRIDDARVKLEAQVSRVFGRSTTVGDISRREPDEQLRSAASLAEIDALVTRFEALAERSRKESLSMLVPMGQEMGYRYQEGVIHDTIAALRAFRSRCRSAP